VIDDIVLVFVYLIDYCERKEGNRLKDLKKKDSEYNLDTTRYNLYTKVYLTQVSVTQLQ
jgi:hypothetical protein